ncbi:hypothetical protein RISK_004345 [Rhodopirellula islandica]|uniref:Uncharacterized protein n=1 Tax=Rhodopirellula islandica TaxID=595434 RepID=A0A0J1BAP7_RHOIS|nr:hypothetical protein RISK_004345 [Rhodopirellula islandica]
MKWKVFRPSPVMSTVRGVNRRLFSIPLIGALESRPSDASGHLSLGIRI